MAFGPIPIYRRRILRAYMYWLWFFCDTSILPGKKEPLEMRPWKGVWRMWLWATVDVESVKETEEKYWREEGKEGKQQLPRAYCVLEPLPKWQNCRSEAEPGH